MTERPILFSAPMVRAILNGEKTQTRRLLKPQPQMVTDMRTQPWEGPADALLALMTKAGKTCPYGQPGDQLWVRETWGLHAYGDDTDWVKGSCTSLDLEDSVITYRADWGPMQESCHWRPSIHMPRSASRLSLEITSVRVERLQDISEADARAEGADEAFDTDGGYKHHPLGNYRDGFAKLWTEINGSESWAANPWVWVVEFTRTK